jgi:hypothetical protein
VNDVVLVQKSSIVGNGIVIRVVYMDAYIIFCYVVVDDGAVIGE